MPAQRVIITLVNSIGPTSMPFNEFVQYRRHAYEETHIVIVLGPLGSQQHEIAGSQDSVELHDCRGSVRRLRALLGTLYTRYQQASLVVHIHHPKAGLLFFAATQGLRCRPPALFTVHNLYSTYSCANKMMSGLNAMLADRVTFVSHAACAAFPATIRRYKIREMRTIQNGVDLERVDRLLGGLPPVGREPAGFRLLNIGRLVRQKNQQFLIDLLPALPDSVSLTIIGGGGHRDQLMARATERGVAHRVQWTGIIPREEVYRQLLQADLFVSSSCWEGLPIAVLEAMALRLPVLLSDIDPHREIAQYGPSVGIAPLSLSVWAETIQRYLAQPAALHNAGAANRRLVEEAFSLHRMHGDYSRLYQEMAA